jgi:tetratricopeptide (TPR) repeat protein
MSSKSGKTNKINKNAEKNAILNTSKQMAGNNSIIVGGNVTRSNFKIEIHPPEQPKPLPATAPRPLDYFMGREKILTTIKRVLVNETRPTLIAITGMGGSGKTSLIKQVAEDVKDEFAENIFWGDLYQSNGDATRILREWAEYCGHILPARKSEEELGNQVRGFLAERQRDKHAILVVIDDLRESWLEAGESLRNAIPAGIPIVITTREIDVAQSLKASKIINLDEHPFSDSEASQLLMELSEKKLTVPQSKMVAKICEKMPLAMELAARVALEEGSKYLFEKLEDATRRLDVLKVGSRERKEASVRETFRISYESLPANSALAFRFLGVFAPVGIKDSHLSGVTNYARQSINAEEELRQLKRYSLIHLDGDGVFYHLHALLHDYAKEVLESQEKTEARLGHFEHFQAVAESYATVALSDRNDDKVKEFEIFYPQMRQALENFGMEFNTKNSKLKSGQLRSAIELIDVLDKYWILHDSFNDQVKWLGFGYDIARKAKLPLKQADFARRAARAAGTLGQLVEGFKWMKRCETALGSRKGREANAIRALMYVHRASLYYRQGEFDKAEKECMRGVGSVSQKIQPKIYAEGYNLLGVIKIQTSRLSLSLKDFEKSIAAWKKAGDQYQIYRTEDNRRSALYDLGNINYLREVEETGLQYWKQFPDSLEYAAALTNRGLVHYIDGEHEKSAELHEEAIEKSDALGEPRLRALTRDNLAWPYIALGKYDKAEELLKDSLKIQEDSNEFSVDTKRCLAEVEIGRKNYPKAIELAEIAVRLAKDEDDPLEEGAALRVLGLARHLNGDSNQALKDLKKSYSLLSNNEYKYESYLTLCAMGEIHHHTGDSKKEGEANKQAKALANEMGLLPKKPKKV